MCTHYTILRIVVSFHPLAEKERLEPERDRIKNALYIEN